MVKVNPMNFNFPYSVENRGSFLLNDNYLMTKFVASRASFVFPFCGILLFFRKGGMINYERGLHKSLSKGGLYV